jgi:succinate dehydrogenase flavin-adding protein (antitoxin of CptAB toxin-antitoxin module)
MKNYILQLINKQQNNNNNFINVSDEDLNYLAKKADTYDMSESEIIEMILDLKYA